MPVYARVRNLEQDLGARKLRESAIAMRDRLQDQDKHKQTVNEQLQKAEQVRIVCAQCFSSCATRSRIDSFMPSSPSIHLYKSWNRFEAFCFPHLFLFCIKSLLGFAIQAVRKPCSLPS